MLSWATAFALDWDTRCSGWARLCRRLRRLLNQTSRLRVLSTVFRAVKLPADAAQRTQIAAQAVQSFLAMQLG
jgi:hypothetical protein